MKNTLHHFILPALMLLTVPGFAQQEKLAGLWEVKKVVVGTQSMTPVSKWFRINPDGTYQSGNGWLQNGEGRWTYDAATGQYSASDPLDLADEAGPFAVRFEQEKMQWERQEEGMLVTITLVPIPKMPRSPADFLKGVWDLVDITENGKSTLMEFDTANQHRFFFRWDRIYLDFTPEGSKLSGYWHINGHKPEITLLPHQEGAVPESWRIEVNAQTLHMTGLSDSNKHIRRSYQRRNSY